MNKAMNRIFIMIGAALLFLASCSKDTVKESNGAMAINFMMSVDTKATPTQTDDLTAFHVSAFDENDDTYFSNILFTNEDEDNYFESEEKYYWPASGELTFYAWAPTEVEIEDLAIEEFTPATKIKDQIDLITATGTGNNSSDAVFLEFTHMLSQVEIKAKNSNTNYVYTVKGVRISKVIESGSLDLTDHEWTPGTTKTDYESVYTADETPVTLNGTAQNVMSAEGNAMLVPQQLVAWNPATDKSNDNNGSYLGIYVNIKTALDKQIYPETGTYGWVAIPVDTQWKAGKKYIYTLDFSGGAGYVSPEDPENPGNEILGESIKFSLNTTVEEWTTQAAN